MYLILRLAVIKRMRVICCSSRYPIDKVFVSDIRLGKASIKFGHLVISLMLGYIPTLRRLNRAIWLTPLQVDITAYITQEVAKHD